MPRIDSRDYKPWDGFMLAEVHVHLGFLDRLRVLFRGRVDVEIRSLGDGSKVTAPMYDEILGKGCFTLINVPTIFPPRKPKGLGMVESTQEKRST